MVSAIPASLEFFTLPLLLSPSCSIAISISWAIRAGNESRWQELVAPYPGSERQPYRQVPAIAGKHMRAFTVSLVVMCNSAGSDKSKKKPDT